jgi:CO/xanthine dehydrogenase FAD-binding subunit
VAVALGAVVRVAVTGVGDHPYRAAGVEAALAAEIDPRVAVASITDGIDVASDIHADAEYRAAMAREMAMRAIQLARARLDGDGQP